MRRTELKRKSPMARGTKPMKRTRIERTKKPVKRATPKRPGKLGGSVTKAMRTKVKRRSLGFCEARAARDCTGYGEHTHHRKLRSQGGTNATVNLLDVCNRCHTWIHANPLKASRRGLLVPSWRNPSDVPVT